MVRAMVGTLLEVGTGKMSIDRFSEILAAKERSYAGVSVPASGLFLSKVEYPKDIYLKLKLVNQERIQAKKILELKSFKKAFPFENPTCISSGLLVFLTISLAAIVPLRPYIVGIIIDNQITSVDYED